MLSRKRATAAAVFAAGLACGAGGAETLIPLWPEGVPGLRADAVEDTVTAEHVSGVHTPTLELFLPPAGTANGTSVIICPGGGYVRLSITKEGTEIAQWLNSIGVTAFILRYRMVEYGHPAPLRDVTRAVRLVRSHAEDLELDAGRIGVLGFSAGGHLASCAATMFDDAEARTGARLDEVSARPDFALLLYPVITMRSPHTHAGSRRALLGEDPAPELVARLSSDERVTARTPPVFLMHTVEDQAVPVENALQFLQALRRAGVPAEAHFYQAGPHGIGLRSGHEAATAWPKAAEVWLRLNGWL